MVTKQERKELTAKRKREQILDAALAVFSRKGFGEATIPDIAHEAGVAVGTIYTYYQSKHDLLVSILERYVVTESLVKILGQQLETEEIKFITSLLEDRINFSFENADRLLFLFSEVQRDPESRQQYIQRVVKPRLAQVEKYLESRIASGTFRPLNVNVIARAIVGIVTGFMVLYRLEGESGACYGVRRQELAVELANFLLRGLLRATED
jgi:AcrR family transcriptional regulator